MPLRRELDSRTKLGRSVEDEVGLAKKLAAEVDDLRVAALQDCFR